MGGEGKRYPEKIGLAEELFRRRVTRILIE